MNLCLVKRLNLEKSKNKLKTRAWVDVVWFSLAIRREQLTAETRGFLENLKIRIFVLKTWKSGSSSWKLENLRFFNRECRDSWGRCRCRWCQPRSCRWGSWSSSWQLTTRSVLFGFLGTEEPEWGGCKKLPNWKFWITCLIVTLIPKCAKHFRREKSAGSWKWKVLKGKKMRRDAKDPARLCHGKVKTEEIRGARMLSVVEKALCWA